MLCNELLLYVNRQKAWFSIQTVEANIAHTIIKNCSENTASRLRCLAKGIVMTMPLLRPFSNPWKLNWSGGWGCKHGNRQKKPCLDILIDFTIRNVDIHIWAISAPYNMNWRLPKRRRYSPVLRNGSTSFLLLQNGNNLFFAKSFLHIKFSSKKYTGKLSLKAVWITGKRSTALDTHNRNHQPGVTQAPRWRMHVSQNLAEEASSWIIRVNGSAIKGGQTGCNRGNISHGRCATQLSL